MTTSVMSWDSLNMCATILFAGAATSLCAIAKDGAPAGPTPKTGRWSQRSFRHGQAQGQADRLRQAPWRQGQCGRWSIRSGGQGSEAPPDRFAFRPRPEEHTSELQSLMRNSYAVFCLKNKTTDTPTQNNT